MAVFPVYFNLLDELNCGHAFQLWPLRFSLRLRSSFGLTPFTCTGLQRTLQHRAVPASGANPDLWHLLEDLVSQTYAEQIEVCWTPSHIEYAKCSTTEEEYLHGYLE